MASLSQNTQDFNFISYTGSEITVVIDINGKKLTVGNLAQLVGQVKLEMVPRYVFGSADPIAASKGKRLIVGKMVFETLNRSFIEDVKAALGTTFLTSSGSNTVADTTTGTEFSNSEVEINYEDQLPPMDIVIVAVKKEDSRISSTRTIKGVTITSKSSSVGLSSLDIQEEYEFMATEITPLVRTNSTSTVSTDSQYTFKAL